MTSPCFSRKSTPNSEKHLFFSRTGLCGLGFVWFGFAGGGGCPLGPFGVEGGSGLDGGWRIAGRSVPSTAK